MVTCRKCGKEMSENAKTCPNCGAPAKPGKTVSIWAIIMAFLIPVVGVILGIIATVKGAKNKYKFALIMGIVSIVVAIVFQYVYMEYIMPAL